MEPGMMDLQGRTEARRRRCEPMVVTVTRETRAEEERTYIR